MIGATTSIIVIANVFSSSFNGFAQRLYDIFANCIIVCGCSYLERVVERAFFYVEGELGEYYDVVDLLYDIRILDSVSGI